MSANEHADASSQSSAATSSEVAAILLASDTPLVWEQMLGQPLLAWSVSAFEHTGAVARAVLVVAPERAQEAEALARREGWGKTHVATAEGGWREALLAGMRALEDGEPAESATGGLLVVHEVARPLVTAELIAASIAAAHRSGVAAAGEPIKETIKRVRDGKIIATVPRDRLVRAQTPLVFSRPVLRTALATASPPSIVSSPECLVSLALTTGASVSLIAGSPENLRVRTPDDLAVAAALLLRRMRTP